MACIVILWNSQMSIHHHLECGDDFLFLDKDAQKLYLRSPVAFVTSGTTELKAAPLWGGETLSSVIYYLIFFFLNTNTYEGKHMLQNKSI